MLKTMCKTVKGKNIPLGTDDNKTAVKLNLHRLIYVTSVSFFLFIISSDLLMMD